jgi:hypothetical protein
MRIDPRYKVSIQYKDAELVFNLNSLHEAISCLDFYQWDLQYQFYYITFNIYDRKTYEQLIFVIHQNNRE